MDEMSQAYHELRLASGADLAAVERAYGRLLRRYPPELNPRRFARIRGAYELLSSYERRMRWAVSDPRRGLDALFPAVGVELEDEPEAPAPLRAEDFAWLLAPLRERVLGEILRAARWQDAG